MWNPLENGKIVNTILLTYRLVCANVAVALILEVCAFSYGYTDYCKHACHYAEAYAEIHVTWIRPHDNAVTGSHIAAQFAASICPGAQPMRLKVVIFGVTGYILD